MKIKKDDTVQIMMGKDKGKTGKVKEVLLDKNMVLVEGINEYKRHRKARMPNEKSEIITISKPMHASKVSLIDPKTKKPTRVGYKIDKDKKTRVSKKSNQKI